VDGAISSVKKPVVFRRISCPEPRQQPLNELAVVPGTLEPAMAVDGPAFRKRQPFFVADFHKKSVVA
jgi:hypothetical protein